MRLHSVSAGWRVVVCMDHHAKDIVACAPLARSLSMHTPFAGFKCSRGVQWGFRGFREVTS